MINSKKKDVMDDFLHLKLIIVAHLCIELSCRMDACCMLHVHVACMHFPLMDRMSVYVQVCASMFRGKQDCLKQWFDFCTIRVEGEKKVNKNHQFSLESHLRVLTHCINVRLEELNCHACGSADTRVRLQRQRRVASACLPTPVKQSRLTALTTQALVKLPLCFKLHNRTRIINTNICKLAFFTELYMKALHTLLHKYSLTSKTQSIQSENKEKKKRGEKKKEENIKWVWISVAFTV